MLTGRIIKGVGGLYIVATNTGPYTCRARGLFKKDGITPLVGDMVGISETDESKQNGYILEIYERKNELVRPRAANVDAAVIVFAAKSPNINLRMLDTLLITLEIARVNCVSAFDILICINKTDLDKRDDFRDVERAYGLAGYPVLTVSAKTGVGIQLLMDALNGRISIMAGPSGVGKTSLINAICPQLALDTDGLSRKTDRGKHTTRHAELYPIGENGDTYIVDAPGFTALNLDSLTTEAIRDCYPEFRVFGGGCYFRNCLHITEPDCAVKERIGEEIDAGRYRRYTEILGEKNS